MLILPDDDEDDDDDGIIIIIIKILWSKVEALKLSTGFLVRLFF